MIEIDLSSQRFSMFVLLQKPTGRFCEVGQRLVNACLNFDYRTDAKEDQHCEDHGWHARSNDHKFPTRRSIDILVYNVIDDAPD